MKWKLLVALVLGITLAFLVDRCRFSANGPGSIPPDPRGPESGPPAPATTTLNGGSAEQSRWAYFDTVFPVERKDRTAPSLAALVYARAVDCSKGVPQCIMMAPGY
jgi:hypothetical protein